MNAFTFDPYAAPPLDYFQEDAVYAVRDRQRLGQKRLLVVMATGLGKMEIISELARLETGRVLVLCHREELVAQAKARIERRAREDVFVEQAQLKASPGARVVVASVQTMVTRLDKWRPDHFDLVIPDEAHRYMAPGWRKVVEHFTGNRVGFTATPDRLDQKSLGALFDATVDEASMDLFEGIEQGWLTPLKVRPVTVKEVHLDGIPIVAGDFAQGALDDEMVKGMLGLVRATLNYEPHRRGILFAPGVRSAEVAQEAFNANIPDSCAFVSSGMPKKGEGSRQSQVDSFRRGIHQWMANCAIFIEGADFPDVDCVIQGRPTKSRNFYAQTIGRGTRVLRDYIEGIQGREQASERRAAIAGCPKPDCMVIDFVGNSKEHSLVGPLDVLGHSSEEELKLAKKYVKEHPGAEAVEAIKVAREQVRRAIEQVKVRVEVESKDPFDPFEALGIRFAPSKRLKSRYSEATPGMIQGLVKIGLDPEYASGLSKGAAGKLLSEFSKRRTQGLLSYKQYQLLRKHGIDDSVLPFHKASEAIDCIISSYKAKTAVNEAEVRRILYG